MPNAGATSDMLSTTPFLLSLCLFQPAPDTAVGPEAVITAIFNDLGVTDFRIRKTKHFVIGYDTSDDFLRPHIGRLEGLHASVARTCEVNGFTIAESGNLLPIIFFDKFHTFVRYAHTLDMPAEGIAGFYHQKNNVAAFANASDLPSVRAIGRQLDELHVQLADTKAPGASRSDRASARALEDVIHSAAVQRDSLVEAFNRFVLQHEAAHQILFNAGVHARGAATPQWLVEGMACQFEVPQADRSGKLQRVNQMRLADLREAMGVPPNANTDFRVDAASLISADKIIPLRQLVSGRGVFEPGDERLKLSYAQSWGFVLYLYRTSPTAFRAYLHTLASRRPGTQPDEAADLAEFESAFGPIDAKFEQSWTDFMLRLRFEP
jgi:hypothetical protein